MCYLCLRFITMNVENNRMKRLISLLMMANLVASMCMLAAKIDVLSLAADSHLPKDIKEVFVDSEGYRWYVTDGGLYQDDGYYATCYRADINHPDLMKSNHITCVAEDCQGRIWIGTRRGAYVLDKRTNTVSPISDEEIVDHVINTIDVTSDGQIWLSTTENLLRYSPQGILCTAYPISHKVQQLYEDSRGNIWRILWRDGLAQYNAQRDTFIPVSWPYKEHPAYLVEDRLTGCYWVSAWERGVARYNPQADSVNRFVWQGVTRRVSPASERKFYNLHTWMDGRYLCGCLEDGRLQLFEVTVTDTLRRIGEAEADSLIPCGVDKKYVHVMVDSNNRLWLTESNMGVQVVEVNDCNGVHLRHKEEITPEILVADSLGCWLQDGFTRKYSYWDLQNEKIVRLPNTDKIIVIKKTCNRDGIYAVRKYNDLVHFSYVNGQIQTERIFSYTLPEDERVRTFYEDSLGRFWLGTNKRLLYYNPILKRLQPIEEVHGMVLSIASDKEGRLYSITEGRNMYRIVIDDKCSATGDVSVMECESYSLQEDFLHLITSVQGHVWGITQQGGVHLFMKENNTFVSYTDAIGLTGEPIVDIAFDSHNCLWLLHNDRLVIYNLNKEDEIPHVISAHSPIMNMEALWSLCTTTAGDVYVGGTKGILILDSIYHAQLELSDISVPLHLTAVQTGEIRRVIPMETNMDMLRLDAADSEVKLFFSTLVPVNAERVRMAWRYRGQQQWHFLAEGDNMIHLTELERGDYRIEVRATTTDGIWSNQFLSLTIRRPYPWFLSIWARILYFALVCVLIAWGYKWLRRSVLLQKKMGENEREVDEKDSKSIKGTVSSEEERFMQNVQTVIETHLGDAEYSIEDLSRDLNMSRASLHRKVKAVSGMTPTELMRVQRLNRASELLKEGRLNVNEVAYAVGFSTPSYFTQLFKKQFGVLPTQYK